MRGVLVFLIALTIFLAVPQTGSAQEFAPLPQIDTFRIFNVPSFFGDRLKEQGYRRPATRFWELDFSEITSRNKGLQALSDMWPW